MAVASVPAALAGDCHEPAAAQNQSIMEEFERRQRMIEALEVLKDDERLSCLVRADTNLDSYYRVLARAASYLKDPALSGKLLNLPVLDKDAPAYKRAAASVFSEIAANGGSTDVKIAAMLLAAFDSDREVKNGVLSFILFTAAMPMPREPNMEMARLLIATGADIKKAAADARERIAKKQAPGVSYNLDRMEAFLGKLVTPEAPVAPAP
ncbi:MAG: hypothetical protein HYU57_04510 [Micavibrio aeruginosavorus]|nr:hypothetical protein [Micavibrio aeruginosavorus]